jgi:hypothetical protein
LEIKERKMKKLKLNFGDGGIQGWLIRHVEKFVLVLFVGVMVWFVVSGSRLEGIKSNQTPDVLRADAQTAVTVVNQSRWNEVKNKAERQAPADVEKQVEELIKFQADKSKYPLERRWNEPLVAQLKPRSDPQILAPLHLKVVTISGPIALIPDDSDVDPLEPVIVEEEEDPKKPKKTPVKKKKPAPSAMPGMPGMAPGMPGMPAAGDKGKGKAKGKAKGSEFPGMPGMAGMPGMPGMGGDDGEVPGMGGMAGMAGTAARGKFSDSQIIGWRPPASSTMRNATANVVMAVVPFEKQTEEFDAKLANSLDYDPYRDKPHYKYFAVQRVDVTANPDADPKTIAEEVWTAGNLNVAASLENIRTWNGYPRDIMDPSYLQYLLPRESSSHPQLPGLTQPLPPFVQRDLYDAMTHPDIPLMTAAAAAPEMPGVRRPKADEPVEGTDDIPTGASGIPGAAGGMAGMPGMGGAGGGPGMPGMAEMMGKMRGGMPGGAGGAAGMPGTAAGGMPGGMPGMAGGGMQGMMGVGGMPGMGSTEALVKYRLVRFVDQKIEKGHQYRYRIKVYVEDPNYPSELYTAPSLAGLDPEARTRVRGLEAKDAKSGKARSVNLSSAWSPASDVVTLPPTEWFYAGSVEPETFQSIGDGKKYTNFKTQAAKALVVVQDDRKAVDVPAKWELFKGSAINFSLPEVDVIHPALGEKRKIEKYSFQTNAVVADMRGGEEIPVVTGEHSNPMKAPGEILIVDAAGNMRVRDEVDDIEYFHRFIGADEPKETNKKKPDDGGTPNFEGMLPGGGMPGMAPGMPGMPSGPSGGKPKR